MSTVRPRYRTAAQRHVRANPCTATLCVPQNNVAHEVDEDVEVVETENEVTLRVDLSGVPMENLKVGFDDGILWVRYQVPDPNH